MTLKDLDRLVELLEAFETLYAGDAITDALALVNECIEARVREQIL